MIVTPVPNQRIRPMENPNPLRSVLFIAAAVAVLASAASVHAEPDLSHGDN